MYVLLRACGKLLKALHVYMYWTINITNTVYIVAIPQRHCDRHCGRY